MDMADGLKFCHVSDSKQNKKSLIKSGGELRLCETTATPDLRKVPI